MLQAVSKLTFYNMYTSSIVLNTILEKSFSIEYLDVMQISSKAYKSIFYYHASVANVNLLFFYLHLLLLEEIRILFLLLLQFLIKVIHL